MNSWLLTLTATGILLVLLFRISLYIDLDWQHFSGQIFRGVIA